MVSSDEGGVHPVILAEGGKRKHHVVVDLDGTLVEQKWPELGELLPGAREAMLRLHRAGAKLVLFSARLNPYDPWTSQARDPGIVQAEYLKVRNLLDASGLSFIDIWRLPGKPGGTVYIDDRAEKYHGRPGSWKTLADKILMKLNLVEAEFPEFNQEVAANDS